MNNFTFLTKKLWGAANEPPYLHHGKFTTLREAVLAHAGEALNARRTFQAIPPDEPDAVIEFSKSLRILQPGTRPWLWMSIGDRAIQQKGRTTK